MTRRILDPMAAKRGKYRVRTWLRKHLPHAFADRIAKGPGDCGNHEWYRQDAETDACYHCAVGRRSSVREGAERPRGGAAFA